MPFIKESNSNEKTKDDLTLAKSISPTDSSYSSNLVSGLSSSPVLSSLPSHLNTLRTNDSGNNQGNSLDGSSRGFLRKILGTNRSSEDVSQLSEGVKLIFSRRSSAKFLVLPEEPKSMKIQSPEDGLELNAQLFRSIGQVRIPLVFLKDGLPLLKISHKSRKRILLKIDITDFNFVMKNAFNLLSIPTSTKIQKLIGTTTYASNKVYEFSVDDIRSVSFQGEAANYREEMNVSKEFEKQWMTIIYFNKKKRKLKSLNLIADTDHDFKKLQSVISKLRRIREDLAKNLLLDFDEMNEIQRDLLFGNIEERNAGKQLRESLSFNDIIKYSNRLKINVNESYLRSIFDDVAHSNEGSSSDLENTLNFEQFKVFVSRLKRRDDVIQIWGDICGKDNKMYFQTFYQFISSIQKDNISEDQGHKIFKKFCVPNSDHWIPGCLNNFLLSKYSQPYVNLGLSDKYFQHPLNEYYISSSHNTYLMGRQVAGDSSIEGYVKALQRGCRCVEIDIWDGVVDEVSHEDNHNEPIVSHGRTFTTAISLRNVMKTIKKYAFITSPHPLILSLEVNCSAENQKKVIYIMKEILGDTLITAPINDLAQLPTPSELKYRILAKVKKTSPFINLIEGENGNYISSTTSTTNSFSEDNGNPARKGSFIRRKVTSTKIIDELSAIGIYLQGLKFRNFSLPESKTYNHCFSLNEKSINLMLKDKEKCASVDKHNRKYFMRIYPSQIRLKSSNFLPLPYWEHGVQMVATNWQTYDLGQQINEAMFDGGIRRGYVLKPKNLRKPLLKSSHAYQILPKVKKIYFEIEIISAHQLPKPRSSNIAINPFISFEIIGGDGVEWASDSLKKNTSVIRENGFNPRWNQAFKGVITTTNDLIFLRFLLNSSTSGKEEEENNTIGLVVAKLSHLKQGYRYLPVNDLLGEELIYSSLFVKIIHYEIK